MDFNLADIFILIEPTPEDEARILAYRQDYIDHGEDYIYGSCGLIKATNYLNWLATVNKQKDPATSFFGVPATTYFTVRKSDNKIVGSTQLRHELTPVLAKRGGHIGYGICPSERQKGYGAIQLKLMLEKARQLHIPRVMISCDLENIASAKTALCCGGTLEKEFFDPADGKTIRIFWIDIK